MLKNAIRRYPLTSFFLLAFGLSWMMWMPYVLGDHGTNVEPDIHIPDIGGSGQLVGLLPGAYLGPLTAAFIVTTVSEGREGLRHWKARLFRWRVGWGWFLGVLFGVPAAILLGTAALPAAWEEIRVPSVMIAIAFVPMVIVQFVTTATAEEPGWRDFALPRLQRRFGPVLGTCVLGLLWGCWHLPLFLTEWGGYPDVSWVQPVEFVASCIPLSLVMTWVFNRSGQSLPLVMLLHALINSTYSLVWPEIFPRLDHAKDTLHGLLIVTTIGALVLIVATRGRLGLDTTEERERPAEPVHV
ncbi:CPBP family intramembrane glutamic endopeptidase [Cryptosporangium arvum]|uniref:CPBP family intramembrane glutamic endopeptidase n=1 Tax=Cryptosporangium arvum TaxID=80871 RepID=UPI0004AF94A1|nr:CPBP family intramembrane glutamic endopeptidase [Cryptosporangium arvum]